MVMIVVIVIMIMIMAMVVALVFLVALFPPFLVLFGTHHMFFVSDLVVHRLAALELPATDVPRVVLPGLHEIHLPVAGVIFVTMQPPRAGMLGGNVQVQRLGHYNMRGRLLDDDRIRIHQRRRRTAAEVDAAIHSRRNLAVNSHSNIHIGMSNGSPQSESRRRPYTKRILHNQSFSPRKSQVRAR
jgi:hypothetical protein